jgi:hypothetical protein
MFSPRCLRESSAATFSRTHDGFGKEIRAPLNDVHIERRSIASATYHYVDARQRAQRSRVSRTTFNTNAVLPSVKNLDC